MNRTPLNIALFLFALFLILGFSADYVTGATHVGMAALSLVALVGAALAAMEAWDSHKG